MDDKSYVNWIKRSENDYNSACHLYNTLSKPSYEVICYLCQQTAEKAVKSVYISKFGIDSKLHTHDISNILKEMSIGSNEDSELISGANRLTQYAVSARYPSNVDYDDNDAKKALAAASYILTWAQRKLMLSAED